MLKTCCLKNKRYIPALSLFQKQLYIVSTLDTFHLIFPGLAKIRVWMYAKQMENSASIFWELNENLRNIRKLKW